MDQVYLIEFEVEGQDLDASVQDKDNMFVCGCPTYLRGSLPDLNSYTVFIPIHVLL